MIYETLRASEIPHAFHKFGLRVYTSPVNFQVANAALANKEQGDCLKDQTAQDAAHYVVHRSSLPGSISPSKISIWGISAGGTMAWEAVLHDDHGVVITSADIPGNRSRGATCGPPVWPLWHQQPLSASVYMMHMRRKR